ncbi:MAG: hypothetical protein WC714_11545 [Candidatus Obscuribacterales bacterium]
MRANQKLSLVTLSLLTMSLQASAGLALDTPVLKVTPAGSTAQDASAASAASSSSSSSPSVRPTQPYSAQKPAVAPDLSATPSMAGQDTPSAPLSQAEIWVRDRFNPGGQSAAQMLQKKKHPVRGFFKSVAQGAAQELGASAHDMAQDMVFVFSVQDIDPYDKTRAPSNKQCVVMEFTMVDGSTAYLHQFPDGSYAIENGFADGTVMVPTSPTHYIIKYPNGVSGTVVRQNDQITVYRPDHTVTTVKKEPSGNYRISNSKFGYMGEARPDDTGNQYGIGAWNYQ